MSSDPTVVFFPEGAYGPTNNCVGIAAILKQRGARVVFVVEESFAGTLAAKGFEEELMRLKPKPEVPEEPGQFWKDFIKETAPQFRKPTIEQLETLTKPIWEELIDGAKYVDRQLTDIFARVGPDVIVEDNVIAFPAVVTAGAPWARIVSCNPLEIEDRALPPRFSGLPSDDDSGWDPFRVRYRELHAELHADFDEFCRSRGGPSLPEGDFMYSSDHLNLYVYPEEADYERSEPLPPTWHRLDSCVRDTDPSFSLPDSLAGGRSLVYLSLGSLGSADVELMNRLIYALGRSDHSFIVSMGPQHDLLTLADNMYGEEFLPQTSIIPLVDAVITHCGNNTVTECLYFGKPMIGLPLFWDQYDNAQRVDELGLGIRLDPYRGTEEELLGALDRLLDGEDVRTRLRAISARLRGAPGTVTAADLIERVALFKEPVTRR